MTRKMEPNHSQVQQRTSLFLNDSEVTIGESLGLQLLDFLRYSLQKVGTKVGCREGDCGACTVLVGTKIGEVFSYRSVTSCLTPLGNVLGKHVVTIEGVNLGNGRLNLVQKLLVENGGTQCGFCTVGFVMSLINYCINGRHFTLEEGKRFIDGNICRCTGYKSIERAIEGLNDKLSDIRTTTGKARIQKLVELGVLPQYFSKLDFSSKMPAEEERGVIVAGGSDLYVQQGYKLVDQNIRFVLNLPVSDVVVEDQYIKVDARITFSQFGELPEIQRLIPGIQDFLSYVASTPIRNIATLGGNIVNASPIGDLTIILLALDSILVLETDGGVTRRVRLRDFYLGYKKKDLSSQEMVKTILIPRRKVLFNFEKVAKRTHLDIASVNSAMVVDDGRVAISIGGVSPIPLFLKRTSQVLSGKTLTPEVLAEALRIMEKEISPISDIRGSAEYKKLLARNLILAHIERLFSQKIVEEVLFS